MAQILINNKDRYSKMPERVDKMYKRGDVVVVKEDDHRWGRLEGLPDFILVKIPDVSAERFKDYIEPGPDERRRKWTLRINKLPSEILNRADSDGVIVVKARDTHQGDYDYTWEEFREFFFDKKNNKSEESDL